MLRTKNTVYGSLYSIRIVGEKYKTFRDTIKQAADNGGLAYNNVDTARVQTVQNFPVQQSSEYLSSLLEDMALPPFKGMIQKVEKYTDFSTNKTVRMYKIFFQYPLDQQTVQNERNLKFAVQVDVLLRCICTSMLNSFEPEVIDLIVDATSETLYHDFVIRITAEFAKEEDTNESSGRQRSVSSSSNSRTSSSRRNNETKALQTKLEKVKNKNKEAKKEMKELLERLERERKEAEKEKKELWERLERERKEAEKEKKELLDRVFAGQNT